MASLQTTQQVVRTKEMDMTFGHLVDLPSTKTGRKKDETMGKALLVEQPFKKTRFQLDADPVSIPNDAMEMWINQALKKDKDVTKQLEVHKFSKEDMRTACKKYGLTRP